MTKRANPLPRVVDDMSKLFEGRLQRLIANCGDTMARAGLDDDTVSKILITSLLCEIVTGTLSMGLDRSQYLAVCALAHDQLLAKMKLRGSGPTRTA